MRQGFYLAIEGNIGSGKTTLSKILAPALNARLVLEEFEDNPFLKGFYKNPERYSFSVEMAFLADRYQQLKKILAEDDLFQPNIVADYAPFKSLIFAQNNLEDQEFKLYRDFWQMSLGKLPQPDLIIYLTKPTDELLRNISKRGRSYEQNIGHEYLASISRRYQEYFKLQDSGNILFLETKQSDFLSVEWNPDHLTKMIIELMEQG